MIKQIRAAQSDNSNEKTFRNLSNHTGEGVVMDIGRRRTLCVSVCAGKSRKFDIGKMRNAKPLEKISMLKATRKPAKGGLPSSFCSGGNRKSSEDSTERQTRFTFIFRGAACFAPVVSGDEEIRKVCAAFGAPKSG